MLLCHVDYLAFFNCILTLWDRGFWQEEAIFPRFATSSSNQCVPSCSLTDEQQARRNRLPIAVKRHRWWGGIIFHHSLFSKPVIVTSLEMDWQNERYGFLLSTEGMMKGLKLFSSSVCTPPPRFNFHRSFETEPFICVTESASFPETLTLRGMGNAWVAIFSSLQVEIEKDLALVSLQKNP